MKHPFTFFLNILWLSCASLAYAQNTVTLTSYYPAPIGAYARLRIIPQNPLNGACDDGSLYFNNGTQNLYLCSGNIWGTLSDLWSTNSVLGLDLSQPNAWVDQIYVTTPYPNLTLRKPWLGIGTQNPQSPLHIVVNDPGTPEALIIDNLNPNLGPMGSPAPGPNLAFYGPRGGLFGLFHEYTTFRSYWTDMTNASANALIELHLTYMGNEDQKFSFLGSGFLGVNHSSGDPIDAILTINGIIMSPYLTISTNTAPANRGNVLNILANGNTGIGTVAPMEKLEVTGNIKATKLILTSDAALKKNIFPLKNTLEKLSELDAISFNWKDARMDNRKHLGIIAQDAQKIFPEIVYGQDGAKAVDYASLISPLIEAVKELKTTNELLNQQFQTQSAQIQKQQQKINFLQKSISAKEMTLKSRSNP